MSELRDLYQEVILDHCKSPRNFSPMPSCDRSAKGFNPLCGDQIEVFLKLNGDAVSEISFQGQGCAICMASASVMTECILGATSTHARALFDRFHGLVTNARPKAEADEEEDPRLEKLSVFEGVREFPVRVKCATLAWHTLKAALNESEQTTVTTE